MFSARSMYRCARAPVTAPWALPRASMPGTKHARWSILWNSCPLGIRPPLRLSHHLVAHHKKRSTLVEDSWVQTLTYRASPKKFKKI